MKLDTLDWLVDTQPVYLALIELSNDTGMYPTPVKAFLRHKLKEEVIRLRETSKHIEKRLKQWEEQTIESARVKKAAKLQAESLPVKKSVRQKKSKKNRKGQLKKFLEYQNEGPSRADSKVYQQKKPC